MVSSSRMMTSAGACVPAAARSLDRRQFAISYIVLKLSIFTTTVVNYDWNIKFAI